MCALKIAYLLTQSLESPGGLGRFGPMAREMAKRGHDVEIFALNPDFNSLVATKGETGLARIHYVAPMHVIKSGNIKSYYSPLKLIAVASRATWELTKAALDSKAEIIHVCKPHPMNGIAGITSKMLKSRQLFVDCDDYEAGLGNFSSRFQRSIVAYFEKKVPAQAQSVTTNTTYMRNKLISWGIPPQKITYIPNGFEPERFKPPDNEQLLALRSQLGLQEKTVISYVGTVGFTSHPVNLLLEAFGIIHSSMDQSVLLIVGGGEDLDLLKKLTVSAGLGHAVVFAGRVPPEQASLYYHLSDVTVDPIYDDDPGRSRSPLKLLESWACGVPVVTGSVGDRPLLMGTPPAGLLSVPGDIDSLAACILKIIQDQPLAQRLKQLGLDRADHYTWDRLVIDLEKVYYQTVERSC